MRYSQAIETSAKAGWIHTPVIVISHNGEGSKGDSLLGATGGHNLDAKVTHFEVDESLKPGQVRVEGEGESKTIHVSSEDSDKVSEIIYGAGHQDVSGVTASELESSIQAQLKTAAEEAPRPQAVALELEDQSPPAFDATLGSGDGAGWDGPPGGNNGGGNGGGGTPGGFAPLSHGDESPGWWIGWGKRSKAPLEKAIATDFQQSRQLEASSILLNKQSDGTYQIVYSDKMPPLIAAAPEDAVDAIVQLMRHQSPPQQPTTFNSMHLELRNFKTQEADGFVNSCRVRSQAEDVPVELSGVLRTKRLAPGDRLINYDYSQAKIQEVEAVVHEQSGLIERGIMVNIPVVGGEGTGFKAKVKLTFSKNTPREVMDALVKHVSDVIQALIAKGYSEPVFQIKLHMELRRISRETGVDIQIIRNQLNAERNDMVFVKNEELPEGSGRAPLWRRNLA